MLETNVNNDHLIHLSNDDIRVTLNKEAPMIHSYQLRNNEGELQGSHSEMHPEIVIYDGINPVERVDIQATYSVSLTEAGVYYQATVKVNGIQAIDFVLVFHIHQHDVLVRMEDIQEHGSFHLMRLTLQHLVSIKEEHSGKLVIPSDTGRVIDITNSSCREQVHVLDWVDSTLISAVYNNLAIGVLESESIENQIISGIYMAEGERYGSLSICFVHRLSEYEFTEYGTEFRVPAIDPRYHLLVQSQMSCTISVLGDYNQDGCVSWVDGAAYIRDKHPVVINEYYADKLISKLFLDVPGADSWITFDHALDIIRRISAKIDYIPHVVYLVGWQYRGHDTGFPAIDEVNERLGGYDKLMNLIEEARKVNTIVSLHDNYDDAYKSSPDWDEDIICRDAAGDLAMGPVFSGERMYIISNDKYVEKYGSKRVHETIFKYRIKETYHLDVLAGGFKGGRKYDFSLDSPAGAIQNMRGKLKLLDEFSSLSIDVTTEDFSAPFVNHVSFFYHLIYRGSNFYQGEEHIPWIPFIYHGMTSYGFGNEDKKSILLGLLYGAVFRWDINAHNSDIVVSRHYLLSLPSQKLYGKEMTSFRDDGIIKRVTYKDGSYVEINVETLQYLVVVEGITIARNFTTCYQVKPATYLIYSLEGGVTSYSFRDLQANQKLSIKRLGPQMDGRHIDYRIENGQLTFMGEEDTAYRITLQPNQ